MDAEDDLLAEQRSYYRARAPEYDEWWQRRGRYDRGEDETVEWNRQVETVEAALAAFGATGDVLELAGGTGWWTERLAQTADSLTVVDASAETIERNRARVGRPDVAYVRSRPVAIRTSPSTAPTCTCDGWSMAPSSVW